MKRHTKIALAAGALLAVGAAAVGGVAYADGPRWGHGGPGGGHRGMGATMLFERFDTNGDGQVTRAEVEAVRTDSLTRFDAGKDGSLSLEEFAGLWQELMREPMVRAFQMQDRDGDGKVTAAEMARPTERMFGWVDRNGDGVITREEITGMRGRRGGDGPGPRGDGPGARGN